MAPGETATPGLRRAGAAGVNDGGEMFAGVPLAKVAEYWDRRPCNIRHSPKEIGTRAYFDEVEARKYFVEPHVLRFAEFPRWGGKRVLEIGCGIGTHTISFAQGGAAVTAMDLSERSLEIARQRAAVYGLEGRVTFYAGNAEELESVVPVEPYDLIFSWGVIHHTPHPARVIDQIRRYVRPGTTVKLMVYHRRSWKVLGIVLGRGRGRFWRLDEIVARHSEAETGCPVTYTYRPRDVAAMLAGFRIREMWVDHIFPYRVADYVQYRYVKTWPLRALPGPAFRRLERHFGWHLCVTAEVPEGIQPGGTNSMTDLVAAHR